MRLTNTRINKRYVLDDSPKGLLGPVARSFKKSLNDPSFLHEFMPLARDYLDKFRLSPVSPQYAITSRNNFVKKISFTEFIKRTFIDFLRIVLRLLKNENITIRSSTPWCQFKHNFITTLRARRLRRRGPFKSLKAIEGTSFVYFPLHFEPEAATMVVSPMFTNQLSVIENLAKSLPINVILAVKENITMLGKRPKGFYNSLSHMPGVVLISPFEESISLIKRSLFTCVITGTAAWEALLLKKSVLIIGEPHFLVVDEGMVHCPNPEKLSSAILDTIKLNPASDEKVTRYIASLLAESFEFPDKFRWGSVSKDIVMENKRIIRNISDRLTDAINNSK